MEHARYEASLASRRYEAVDPAKRLVVRGLEARWNIALERVAELEQRITRMDEQAASRPQVDKESLLTLAHDLTSAWDAPGATGLPEVIRCARLFAEPVAVILSAQQRVVFSIMSPSLRKQRNLAWLKKGIGIPQGTSTYQFGQNADNIIYERSVSGESTLEDWFEGYDTELKEEVTGLCSYRRVLTVLSAESLPDPDETFTRLDGRTDEEAESLLPPQRGLPDLLCQRDC